MEQGKDQLSIIKDEMKNVMAKYAGKLSPKDTELFQDVLNKVMIEGYSVNEALGIPKDFLEGIYEHGYRLYQSGHFEQALSVFRFLKEFDGTDPRFYFSIAATLHQMKQFEEAAGNYFIYVNLEHNNPLGYYHMSDCFEKLGKTQLASGCLYLASKIAEKIPKYQSLKNKIDLILFPEETSSSSESKIA